MKQIVLEDSSLRNPLFPRLNERFYHCRRQVHHCFFARHCQIVLTESHYEEIYYYKNARERKMKKQRTYYYTLLYHSLRMQYANSSTVLISVSRIRPKPKIRLKRHSIRIVNTYVIPLSLSLSFSCTLRLYCNKKKRDLYLEQPRLNLSPYICESLRRAK